MCLYLKKKKKLFVVLRIKGEGNVTFQLRSYFYSGAMILSNHAKESLKVGVRLKGVEPQ